MKFACAKCGFEGELHGPIPSDVDMNRFRCGKCSVAEMLADIPGHMKKVEEAGKVVADRLWEGICEIRLQLMEALPETVVESAVMNATVSTAALAITHMICPGDPEKKEAAELFKKIRLRLQSEVEKILQDSTKDGMVLRYDTRPPEPDSDSPAPPRRGEITG